eukprot:3006275-Pleurochrysis_carterae.AAC.2
MQPSERELRAWSSEQPSNSTSCLLLLVGARASAVAIFRNLATTARQLLVIAVILSKTPSLYAFFAVAQQPYKGTASQRARAVYSSIRLCEPANRCAAQRSAAAQQLGALGRGLAGE